MKTRTGRIELQTLGCLAAVVALSAGAAATQGAPHPLAQALAGSWSGTLEYRDYSSDRRVTLPTKLVIASPVLASNEESSLQFEYSYDEGKGRFVTSSQRVTIAAAPPTYRVQSSDGKNDTTYDAQGLADIRDGAGTVILTGRGRENDQDVDVRTTITITPSTLTMRRDSRLPGDEWRFRNQYVLKR